jgi:hypothetical protein
VFDHVESKVVETTESPNDDEQKDANLQCRTLEEYQAASQETQQQKQSAFYFDQGRARQVPHVEIFRSVTHPQETDQEPSLAQVLIVAGVTAYGLLLR